MLNVGALHEGFVLDHIKAGKAMTIYHDLKLDKLDCTVAIIKNAKSNKMGVKDIIKVECPIENLDLDILGFIDHNITVNIIKDEKIVEKRILKLPKQITNVIKCKNPRCITSIEQGLDQVFILADPEKEGGYRGIGLSSPGHQGEGRGPEPHREIPGRHGAADTGLCGTERAGKHTSETGGGHRRSEGQREALGEKKEKLTS